MDPKDTVDARASVDRLLMEIDAYLALVDTFRGEGIELQWTAERSTELRVVRRRRGSNRRLNQGGAT